VKRQPARVLVAAESDVAGATIEAALRDRADLSLTVGPLRALTRLIEEHDPAAVVVAASAAGVRAALAATAALLRPPAVILMVADPRAVWTPATRRAGVLGVLGRDASGEELAAAIAAATAGLMTLHPDVYRPASPATLAEATAERALTPREREILGMIAEGLSNRMIARRLEISTYTVKFHVAAILAKLGAASRAEAVTVGVRRGLITL